MWSASQAVSHQIPYNPVKILDMMRLKSGGDPLESRVLRDPRSTPTEVKKYDRAKIWLSPFSQHRVMEGEMRWPLPTFRSKIQMLSGSFRHCIPLEVLLATQDKQNLHNLSVDRKP